MIKRTVGYARLRLIFLLIAAGVLAFLLGSTSISLSPSTDQSERVALNQDIGFLLIDTQAIQLNEVSETQNWPRNDTPNPVSFGFTDDTVWLHAQVSPEQVSQAKYVVIPYPLLEQVEVFWRPQDPLASVTAGTTEQPIGLPRSVLRSHNHVFTLPENTLAPFDLLIQARSSTSLQVPVELWSQSYFYQRQLTETLFWGLYFGTLIALFAYNLFVFYSVRDRAYAYYVFYLAALTGLMLGVSGFGKVYIWGSTSSFNQAALPLFAGISSMCGLLFARSFLAWENKGVPLNRWLLVVALASLGVAALGTVRPTLGAELSAGLSGIVFGSIILAATLALRAQIVIARYFLLAWTCFGLGTSLYLLNVFGLIPVTQVNTYSMQVGSSLEVILLSLALAHRIKMERQQKMIALENQHKAERQIKEMRLRALENSMHDRSTGMPNDSLLLARMRELTETAQTQRRDFYLVMVNFPQLKDIASTLGRSLYLDLFRTIVEDLNHESIMDPYSISIEPVKNHYVAVTDLGNLAMLYDGKLSEEDVSQNMRNRLRKFEKTVALGPLALVMDAYCGIAHQPRHSSKPEQLFQQALLARDAGVPLNRHINCYNAEIDDAGRRKLALQGALTQAIQHEELELFLQPQFGCNGLDLVGAEILLRWHSKDYGMVPTQEFIEIAEQAGLMDKLTQYVIHKSLLLLKDLQQLGIRLSVSINLSVQNLMEPEFAEFVIGAAHCHAIQLKDIILEVTETAMSKNMESVIKNLQRLSDYGAHIALDDFGTGYSSLTYLSRLPIDELKIDKSFILQMKRSESDLRIVENTIKLARALRLQTVAEGVEDQEALSTVTRLGCHRVQGYHTGRPMDVASFKAWALTRQSA